jgi:hypothetical protein
MSNLTILLLTIIAAVSSVSIIKTELTAEEILRIPEIAIKAFTTAIDNCEQYSKINQSLDENASDNICIDNLNLFHIAMQHIPFTEIKSIMNKCSELITKKAQETNCISCNTLARHFKMLEEPSFLATAKEQIKAGNGTSNIHQLNLQKSAMTQQKNKELLRKALNNLTQ